MKKGLLISNTAIGLIHKEDNLNTKKMIIINGQRKDTWDALTDGQYGDYPEEGVDWDRLYDALGL